MRLVELTHFDANYEHPMPIMVNPDHVVYFVTAQGRPGEDTCWIRMAFQDADFLVAGSMDEIAETLMQARDLDAFERRAYALDRTRETG